MRKSIFEKECERLQPILLERKSKMNKNQAYKLVKDAIGTYSFVYASGYALAYSMVFTDERDDECSKIKLVEIVSRLKKLNHKENEIVFEGCIMAVAEIYGRTYEEISDLLENKEYWMAYGAK